MALLHSSVSIPTYFVHVLWLSDKIFNDPDTPGMEVLGPPSSLNTGASRVICQETNTAPSVLIRNRYAWVVDADTHQHLRRHASGIRFYTCQVVPLHLPALGILLEPIVMNLAQQISCVLPHTAILIVSIIVLVQQIYVVMSNRCQWTWSFASLPID